MMSREVTNLQKKRRLKKTRSESEIDLYSTTNKVASRVNQI